MAKKVVSEEPSDKTVIVEDDRQSNIGLILGIIVLVIILLLLFGRGLFGGGGGRTNVNVTAPKSSQ